MTPAARYQAAIDVLDAMAREDIAAEPALLRWSRGARYAGSKDRAAVRDIVFSVLRNRNSCAYFGGGAAARSLVLGYVRLTKADPAGVFTGQGHAPPPLTGDELNLVSAPVKGGVPPDMPDWLLPELEQSLGACLDDYLAVMRERAAVFLRVNILKGTSDNAIAALSEDGIETLPHPKVDGALIVRTGARRLPQSRAVVDGLIEIQDAHSQALVACLKLQQGQSALDYCAGGGGKALAMAQYTQARVAAHDQSTDRMQDIPARAARAGVDIKIGVAPGQKFDLVLCDVPCSGSGAWRRAADARWRLTPQELQDLQQRQQDILKKAGQFVKPGGRLAYATCSVLRSENEKIVNGFAHSGAGWTAPQCQRWPASALGDGFFLAVFEKRV